MNNAIKSGGIFFFLWGLLHFLVGYPALLYPFSGPEVVLEVFKITPMESGLDPNLQNAAYLGLNFLIDLMAFGVLGMWLGILIFKGKYVQLSYWLCVLILGIVDIAFVIAMVIPGISPLSEAIWGPVLYVLGTALTGYGLYKTKK